MTYHAWLDDGPKGLLVQIGQVKPGWPGHISLSADEVRHLHQELQERTTEPCECGSTKFVDITVECAECGAHRSG